MKSKTYPSSTELETFFGLLACSTVNSELLKKWQEDLEKAKVSFDTETFLTAAYFITRPGLWVHSPEFGQEITEVYPEPIPRRGVADLKYFDFEKPISDFGIVDYLGGDAETRRRAVSPDQIASLVDSFLDETDFFSVGDESRPSLLCEYVPHPEHLVAARNIFFVVGRNAELFRISVSYDEDYDACLVYLQPSSN